MHRKEQGHRRAVSRQASPCNSEQQRGTGEGDGGGGGGGRGNVCVISAGGERLSVCARAFRSGSAPRIVQGRGAKEAPIRLWQTSAAAAAAASAASAFCRSSRRRASSWRAISASCSITLRLRASCTPRPQSRPMPKR